ncbi:F-box/LRR-repeat protein 7-like, partial [Limulus polyphemus]|uniref:F-box/LRR-repeat protein 7-like n=1 Tax=Limulus polyphemus TaxID=6850 RepID=A0ABM1TJG8_LIMPO
LTNNVLRSILKKCGCGLKRVNVSTTSHQLDFQAAEIIAQFCPNLEAVDLAQINLTNMSLKQMSKKCCNLKKQSRIVRFGDVRDMLCLQKQSRIVRFGDVGDMCLQKHPGLLAFGGFEKIATKCSKLKALYLNDCVRINDQALETLCENLQEIKILHIGGALTQLSAAGLCHVGKLGNLEQLSLFHNAAVDDVVIGAVTQGCQRLRYLDISGCNEGVTDLSLKFLSKCLQLKTLYINYCGKITDIGLSALATQENLEVLQTRGCPQLGDAGLTSVILLCRGLTSLDISGCFYVTNAVLQACLDAVRHRTSGNKLVVTVGGTSVVPETLNLDSPLLEVSQFNLCANHLRPDRADWIGQYHSDYEEELEDKHEEGADGGEYHQIMDEFMDKSVDSDDDDDSLL